MPEEEKSAPIECEATICGRTWTKQPDEFDMRELDFVEV